MSYNIYLHRTKCCERCDCEGEAEDIGNMTSNVSPMWTLALGFPLADLDGRLAGECIPDLERAVAHIRAPAHAADYVALNPPNGWGSHESAASYLERLLEGCRDYPRTTIRISR